MISLSNELLFTIFKQIPQIKEQKETEEEYVTSSVKTLCAVKKTCKQFQEIVNDSVFIQRFFSALQLRAQVPLGAIFGKPVCSTLDAYYLHLYKNETYKKEFDAVCKVISIVKNILLHMNKNEVILQGLHGKEDTLIKHTEGCTTEGIILKVYQTIQSLETPFGKLIFFPSGYCYKEQAEEVLLEKFLQQVNCQEVTSPNPNLAMRPRRFHVLSVESIELKPSPQQIDQSKYFNANVFSQVMWMHYNQVATAI